MIKKKQVIINSKTNTKELNAKKQRYLPEVKVLGFLPSDDSEEKEICNWIFTDDGKEDREEIPSRNSSSEEEMDDLLRSSASANYFVPKPKRGKQHLLHTMLVVQLRIMPFGKSRTDKVCKI